MLKGIQLSLSLSLPLPPSQYTGRCDVTLDIQDMRLESLNYYMYMHVDETQPAKIYKLACITRFIHKQYKRGNSGTCINTCVHHLLVLCSIAKTLYTTTNRQK